MAKRKDEEDGLPPPEGGNGAASSQTEAPAEESAAVEALRHDLEERDGVIRELEASLELESRVSATLRENLRKLTERITRLEEGFAGRPEPPAEGETDASASGVSEAPGAALAETEEELARITAERDAFRDKIKALERMQTETVTLPDGEGVAPEEPEEEEDEDEGTDLQPSINELLESLSSIERPGVTGGLQSLPGSGPGEHAREEPWSELIAPEVIAPEAFEAGGGTAQHRVLEPVMSTFGYLVTLGGKKETRYALQSQVTTIGRAPNCDIQINAVYVSRMHARILSDHSSIVIEDAGSKNGIRVNGDRTERCVLKSGDVINIGPLRIRLEGLDGGDPEDSDASSSSNPETEDALEEQ